MDKRSIFIAIHYLELGGAEISLIGLLQSLDYSKYDVDLFVYSHRGELMDFIPPQVNLLPEKGGYPYIETHIWDTLKKGYAGLAVRRLLAKIRYASYKKKHPSSDDHPLHFIIADTILPSLPGIGRKEGYDLAISYLQPHNIVLEKVKARKKACWIHTDYANVGVDPALEVDVWNGYDHIVSISEAVTASFLKAFPSLENKIVLMKNILPSEFVRRRASDCDMEEVERQMPKRDGAFNFLSVGRFCYAKNYDNIPDICRRILDKGVQVFWYLIGYGSDEELIKEKIRESNVSENVIILGKKSNPYPYMEACDVYVQPSRYEGNSVTVREAQMLGKTVVITDYPTSSSQVRDGEDGFIVPSDNEGCADAIISLLGDPLRLNGIGARIKDMDFSNKVEVEVLDKLF